MDKFDVSRKQVRKALLEAKGDYLTASATLESKKFISSVRLCLVGRRSSVRFSPRGSQPYKFAPSPNDHELQGGIRCRGSLPRGRSGGGVVG